VTKYKETPFYASAKLAFPFMGRPRKENGAELEMYGSSLSANLFYYCI
jgi:hypothetical protein